MWKRSELKKAARGALKRNYWSIVILCTLVAIIMGNFANPVSNLESALSRTVNQGESITENTDDNSSESQENTLAANAKTEELSNTDIVDAFLGGVGMENEKAKRWTNGVLSAFADNYEGAGSVLYGIMNTINQSVFNDRVNAGIVIAIGTLIQLLILLLFKNVIQVAYARYMLETRCYNDTHITKLFFPWRIKRGGKTAWIMFVKRLYLTLWQLTIIGGIIKRYSYRMTPFIAAENPDIKAREAIKLSAEMMNGSKWDTFKLDVSFVLWRVLSLITLGLLDIFYLKPYKMLTDAELYMTLRKNINSEKLCDKMLDVEIQDGEYPIDKYIIPTVESRKWLHADYNRKYSISSLILIFFTFSFIGWIWEVSLHLFKDGQFVNRGVSYGPWLPIYGVGGVLALVALKKIRNKPVLTFLATMVLCGIVEYFTSFYLEMTKGLKWWDYSGYFLNLNGRICLEGLFTFALGGCAAIYLIAPALDDLFKKIPKRTKLIICASLTSLFLADQVYSHFRPNTGKGITDYKTSFFIYKERLKG